MTVQRIGPKKLAKCSAVTGRAYTSGWTRGGWPHGWFSCQFPSESGKQNTDWVNPKTGEWEAERRDGKDVGERE